MNSPAYRGFCERLFRQNELAIKLGVERIRAALDEEGGPDRTFEAILVAGTNGKGSVASLVHAGLLGAGLRVGLYTSPHLVDLRERIRVDGAPIGEADLLRIGMGVLDRWGEPSVPVERRLTYFELVTVMACLAFAERGVDVAVMEVGLGGRLDATNALDPSLSVVTEVSLDHQPYLGDTVDAIFGEKLGILRSGRPAVVVRPVGWTTDALEQRLAGRDAVPLWLEGRDFGGEPEPTVDGVGLGTDWIPFPGAHQRRNAACAAAALELGRRELGWPVERAEGLPRWLTRARWPGRWTKLELRAFGKIRSVVVDGAHNPRAAEVTARLIAERLGGAVSLIVGVSQTKDIGAMLAALEPVCRRIIAVGLNNPRGMPVGEVAAAARTTRADVLEAVGLEAGLELAARFGEPIVALGSLYLVGEAMELAGLRPEDLVVFEPMPLGPG